MKPYQCVSCGDEIDQPADVADCYCELCMELIMFDVDCEDQEKGVP